MKLNRFAFFRGLGQNMDIDEEEGRTEFLQSPRTSMPERVKKLLFVLVHILLYNKRCRVAWLFLHRGTHHEPENNRNKSDRLNQEA